MKIIIALIPDKSFSNKLNAISKQISSQIKSEYINGMNNIPHCSILQFETKMKLKEIQKLVSKHLSKKITLTTGKSYQREHKITKGKFWFGLEVKRTENLENLQKQLAKSLNLKEQDLHNKLGKNYKPHFSTAMSYNVDDNIKLENNPSQKVKCSLHICRYGKNYAVKKILI